MPGATVVNAENITGACNQFSDRDFDALMGVGSFNIWLEGTTFNNPTSGKYAASLWKILYDGTPGTFVVDQAGGPFSVGASNGLRWNQTAAGSGDTFRLLEFRVEDASTFNNGKATLSFFTTGATSFNIRADVVQFFGTGGSPSADVVCGSKVVAVTTSTTRTVLTVDMPSTASKTFGTTMDDCVKIRLYLPTNTTFNCVFNECRFERGSIRSVFSQIPLSMEHGYIDRYLQYSVVSLGATATAINQYIYGNINYKCEMRTPPVITWATLSGGTTSNTGAGVAATFIQKYGATAFIYSAAAGPFFSLGQQAKLDARL